MEEEIEELKKKWEYVSVYSDEELEIIICFNIKNDNKIKG